MTVVHPPPQQGAILPLLTEYVSSVAFRYQIDIGIGWNIVAASGRPTCSGTLPPAGVSPAPPWPGSLGTSRRWTGRPRRAAAGRWRPQRLEPTPSCKASGGPGTQRRSEKVSQLRFAGRHVPGHMISPLETMSQRCDWTKEETQCFWQVRCFYST